MAAYAALVSVKHIIDNLQLHPRPPISLHKNQAYILTQKLVFLLEFLEGYNPHLAYSTKADPLEIRIANAAYMAEHVIESQIVDQITSNEESMSYDDFYQNLEMVIEEMELIEKETMQIKQTSIVDKKSMPPDSFRSSSSSSSSSSSITQKGIMVGADDVLLEMKDKLTSNCRNLQIIPVHGMGGAGKTTLAINIYQDRLIKESFDVCVWATISQEYSIQDILMQILRQLKDETDQCFSGEALGDILHKHLFGKKYLIIMDDMWGVEAWDKVRRFFPDNKNYSRVLITTRLSNLASELSNSNSLEMKLLNEDDSWNLLSKTVFCESSCPDELKEIGKKIGKSCGGLPLSIVVVGGFLAKSKHTKEFWEHIERNLSSIVNSEDNEHYLKILHMSYKQLPVYLKPCFLYMGMFPEDKVIRISRLIKLWVSEGFIRPVSGKTLEQIAKVYLKDLAERNLVLIDKIGSTGNIKQCKIHDLLRDLSLREAQKERFYTHTSQGIVNGSRRIVISKNEDINTLSLSSSRSLMWNLHQVLPPLIGFRLLRILDSCRSIPIVGEDFIKHMHRLVNSRFLAIATEFKLPSSIWLFWNLQTLIVGQLWEYTVPIHIWYMPHIRHVKIRGLRLPNPPQGQDDGIVLENLQSLGIVMNFECNQEVVRRIPNIKKLKIFYVGFEERYSLTNLNCLDNLESLSCAFYQGVNPRGLESLHSLINFSRSIKKLSLRIHQSEYWAGILDKIGALPFLEKLKLLSGSFREGVWKTTEGQFCNLKFLYVRACNGLHFWTAESSHFPCLNHLILEYVDHLKEIPLDFAEISTLRVIHMRFCSNSAVVSAKRILEEQEELYGEVAIHVKVKLGRGEKVEALENWASPNFRVTM